MARTAGNMREKILDAAITLLRESGVKKLAQPQVAKAAGVPQGHLTYYFPKKFDLLAAIAERFVEMLTQDYQALSDPNPAEPQKHPELRNQAWRMAHRLIKDRERTRMLLGLVVEAEADPSLRTALDRSAGFVRGIIARATGISPHDPDVDIMLATLWGLGLQYLIFSESRSEEDFNRVLERVRVWFETPRAPSPQSSPSPSNTP